MSFMAISSNDPTAVELLRLLSFLNPDGILIRFLRSGADGIQGNLRQIISHHIKLQKAFCELERFSLVKRKTYINGEEMFVIHRLVQAVIKDEMTALDLMSFTSIVVDICDEAFPQLWNEKTWALCRLYVDQVMGPLMHRGASETEKFANVVHRVAWFLRDDGKAIDSERLLVQVLEKHRRILGAEHPYTVTLMHNLALTYWAQGRAAEAAAL
jgi:hypothetical protein